jgi:hypothetical protein
MPNAVKVKGFSGLGFGVWVLGLVVTSEALRKATRASVARIQNTEYRIQNTEYRIQNTEYRIQNTEYRDAIFCIHFEMIVAGLGLRAPSHIAHPTR